MPHPSVEAISTPERLASSEQACMALITLLRDTAVW